MARTADEIKKAMITNITNLNPSIEAEAGPIYDTVVSPVSTEFAEVEKDAEHLAQLYSTAFIKSAEEKDVNAYITNFSLPQGAGSYAKGNVYFATYTQLLAGEEIIIPEGTLVANSDKTLVYQVTEERKISGNTINTFYNAANSWYEVAAPIQAVNIGTTSNLPALRIVNLLTPIDRIDKVTNKEKIEGGLASESNERKFQRVENAFFGQNSGTQAGVIKTVESYSDKVSAVTVVRSGDSDLFVRYTSKLAIDIYVLGTEEALVLEEEYTTQQDTNYITLNQNPVTSVSNVLISGTASTAWQFQADTSTLKKSTRAQDKVVFDSVLPKNTTVTITYSYNKLLHNIANIFSSNQDNLFDMDTLVRSMLTQSLVIQGTVTPTSSSDPDTVKASTTAKLKELIETNKNGDQYVPEAIKQELINSVSGLSDFSWKKFTSSSGATNVEIITLPKNTIAKIDTLEIE